MDSQQDVLALSSTLPAPHPVALATIELLEQALATMLTGMRRGPQGLPIGLAGAIEYDSWLVNLRR
jgi:hypothetical protein